MKKSTYLILTALFAALICAGCFIQIPLPGGIPIVIQDMMAMLSGLLLGPLYGAAAVAIFLLLGVIGLPVFTGKAGIQVLIAGPTGGFLWGYLAAAIVGGLFFWIALPQKIDGKKYSPARQYVFIAIAAFLATATAFALGIVGFMLVTKVTLAKTLAAVLLPFIPGNTIKLVLMIFITKKFRPVIFNYTH